MSCDPAVRLMGKYTKELKIGALKYIRQKQMELEGERNSDTIIAVSARYTLQVHMEHFLG